MEILDVQQGTSEWLAARMGAVTGTRLKHVFGTSEARRALIAELIAEEATEQAKSMRVTEEMERGSAEEAFAVRAYEQMKGVEVDRPGLLVSDKFPWLKHSPDGLIKKDGVFKTGLEIKCPDSKKAILYKIENLIPMEETGLIGKRGDVLSGAPFCGIPSEYKYQVLNYFLVADTTEDLDFMVYDARFIDDSAQSYVVNIRRDDPIVAGELARIEAELEVFRRQWMTWKEIVLPTSF